MFRSTFSRGFVQTLVVVTLAACVAAAPALAQKTQRSGTQSSGTSTGDITQIQHIIFIVKENRSFDHYFGTFPGAEGTIQQNGMSQALLSTGQWFTLQKLYDMPPRDIAHNWNTFIQSMDYGRMDHFDSIKGGTPYNCSTNNDEECLTQAVQSDLPNYWKYAQDFALADHAFSSIHGPSFPSHFYTVAASSAGVISESRAPTGGGTSACEDAQPGSVVTVIDGQGNITNPFPCFDLPTMADTFRNASPQITWRFYSGKGTLFNGYEAVNHIRNSAEWDANVIDPGQFPADAAAGNLPDVTWLISDDANNEHPSWSTCNGENWTVTDLNAVMNNPTLWNNTVIFLEWDEAGGFYDHVPPPQPDIYGFGPRVPFIIISPFVKKGIYKEMLDAGTSPLAFIEARYNLSPLTERDAAANNLLDAFDFTQSPLPPDILTTRSCSPVGTTYLNYAQQKVGTPSSIQTTWIRNYDTVNTLTINSIGITSGGSDFTQTNTCPASIKPRNGEADPQNCVISVTFTPSSPGPKTGTLTEVDSTGTHTITLTGDGTSLTSSPALLTFPQTIVGTSSSIMTGTLTNNSSSSIPITSISVVQGNTDYSETTTCGSMLNAGAKCNINVTFTPTATGSRFGQIQIVDADAGSPQFINVTGMGTALTFSPTTLTFADTGVGAASASQPITVTNGGGTPISLMGTTFVDQTYYNALPDYTESDSCNGTVPAFGSCVMNISFTPQSVGLKLQYGLIFTSEATTSPFFASVTGTAISNAVPKIRLPLLPTTVAPGSGNTTLTVNGSGFASGATVNWNGAALATTFVSSGQLTATIPSAKLTTASTGLVTVTNPAPNGGTSNVGYVHVTTPLGAVAFRKADFSIGTGPRGVAVGDINGDGRLDLAVTDNSSNKVSILLSNGHGAFSLKSAPATGMGPTGVALADFNGDGRLDLAIANNVDNTVSILKGNGDGTFTQGIPLTTNPAPIAIVTGDFNGDGRTDIIVANNGEADGIVFLGKGDGTFINNWTTYTGAGPTGLTVDDFNSDNLLDIVSANQLDSTIYSLPGYGDGTLGELGIFPAGNGADAIASADFDGDGKTDLAVANFTDNTVTIWKGNGDSTFAAGQVAAVGTGPIAVVIGDFNGDGKLDIATANNGSNNISLLLGNGDGTFQAHQETPAGMTPSALAAVDFNNDGKLDLAVANQGSNSISVLTAQGSIAPPVVTLNPTSLNFGTVAGGTTQSMPVTLTNSGGSTLTFSGTGISISGTNAPDFSQTNTCGTSVAAGASCTITVSFSPKAKGNRSANVSIMDNASGSPQMVPLSGVGTIVVLNPTSLNFGNQNVGMASSSMPVTMTNTSSGATVGSIVISFTGTNATDFTETDNCGTSLAKGASCTINVVFTPGAAGARSGTLSVADNGGGSPQTVSLSGNGVTSGAQVTLNPTSLSFATRGIGNKSAPKTVTMTNTGNATLTGITIGVTGTNAADFGQTNTCTSTLAVNASCTISVTFTPQAAGARSAMVSITDSASDSPQSVPLSGTGTAVNVNPTTLTFPNTTVGMTSSSMTSTVMNVGTATVNISSIAIGGNNPGDFPFTTTCPNPGALNAGASCTITVNFKPTMTGSRSASINVTDDDPGSPQKITLSGTGQ